MYVSYEFDDLDAPDEMGGHFYLGLPLDLYKKVHFFGKSCLLLFLLNAVGLLIDKLVPIFQFTAID